MAITANDNFEVYYSEKLWELIPPIYRQEDGLADPKDVLRGLIEVVAQQTAILRRSQDRLWEDQFIDLCDDWAVSYIAGLLATRLLSAQNERGRRIDVAKTIYYRRRKGTPRILEELISDVSGWKGKLVESFQRLARTRHGLDPKPLPYAGRFTGTMPGGIADLRNAAGSELASGPFDEYYHTPDFRRPRGMNGRYGITKLNFHLYRLVSFEAINIVPRWFEVEKFYTFDPSGRLIPLFVKDPAPKWSDWEKWHSAFEWELPLSIRCRLLGHAEFEIKEKHILEFTTNEPIRDELRKLAGIRFRSEAAFLNRIDPLGIDEKELMRLCIVDLCAKNQLWPRSLSVNPGTILSKENIKAASFDNGNTDPEKEAMIDAEQGRFWFTDHGERDDLLVTYNYGFAGPCGAGFYDRKIPTDQPDPRIVMDSRVKTNDIEDIEEAQVLQLDDSKTYVVDGDMEPVRDFTMQAKNQERPYIRLDKDWIFSTGIHEDSKLVLDGLWIGSEAGSTVFKVILRGDFECIIIRNCTFDPGGVDAHGDTLHPVDIIIEGNVENLCIENSIIASITIGGNSLLDETLSISDSILQSQTAIPAILATSGNTNIQRTTIFGGINVHRLYASDTIITGLAIVTDNQTGCFRFSTAPSDSILPRPYESFLFDIIDSNDYWFTSKIFGHPGFGQLSVVVPVALYRGGENGAEMGAFNKLINAIILDGLKIKVDEYMPFGLIPAFINET